MEIASVFIQELLKQIMPWLVSILVALIIKWAGDLWLQLKASQPDTAAILQKVAEMAVYAAEQAKLQGWISDKKAWAEDWAEDFLITNYGLKLDLKVIGDAIEAEVRKMNQLTDMSAFPDIESAGD